MLRNIGFHRIKKVTISEPRLYGGSEPFSARSIVLTNAKGETFEITVFNDENTVEFAMPHELGTTDSFIVNALMA
jgi:hypothetical protein